MAKEIIDPKSVNKQIERFRISLEKKPTEPYEYPYSITGKIRQFPYKFYWQQGRWVRYLAAGVFVTMLIEWQIQKKARTPARIKEYHEEKLSELISFFEFDPKADRQGKDH